MRSSSLRGIGVFDAEHFDPGRFFPNNMYTPLLAKDRFDAFWGAKILMRFKPHELAAIIEEAQFSDPRSAKYMLDTLVRRQRMTGRYWFDRVAPLDKFEIKAAEGGCRLCFTDLTLHYQLRESRTSYAIDTNDRDGKATGYATRVVPRADARGTTCTTLPLTAQGDAYTIVRLRVVRGSTEMSPVIVHVARLPEGRLEVIGLRRR